MLLSLEENWLLLPLIWLRSLIRYPN